MSDSDADRDPTRVFDRTGIFETWDQDFYHPVALELFDNAIPLMLDMLGANETDIVLDAGCGPGVHSIRAARRGCRVHAVDVSTRVIEEARRRAERAGFADRITFGVEDLTELGFRDEAFQHIFAWGVLTHIPDMARALDELARVLGPGGRLALEITNLRAVDHRLLPALRRLFRRPSVETRSGTFGRGVWHAVEEEHLWVWHADIDAITDHLDRRRLKRVFRGAAELTNMHWKIGGWLGRGMMHSNNWWFRRGLPAGPAATNLLVFEKPPEGHPKPGSRTSPSGYPPEPHPQG